MVIVMSMNGYVILFILAGFCLGYGIFGLDCKNTKSKDCPCE